MRTEDIGLTLRNRRKHLHMTQTDLAELAGVSKNSLYKIELGQINPTIGMVLKLAEVLGLELRLEVRQPR